MRATLALVIFLGTTGCSAPIGSLAVSQAEVCDELERPIAELRRGLTAHPETHDDVGGPGVEVIITAEAGCRL
ncbi:hypothetical protein [Pelagovum pacificum]|uniref:Uncharacterized protein n=1 Tax=Pelagovum pacificum TaxID=2588711 RepID=A0A5C5GDP7_9RHOB|nr:hypothetical protein [Pelagovum pacificum]QQA43967.1 hypothetical protein I8N54_05145 [Pelagovum pacificum]TNY32905.1 hypothetical protein FHY64_06410 [Pelagovum pacificum]